jgi:iron complex outermembrane receptor protein
VNSFSGRAFLCGCAALAFATPAVAQDKAAAPSGASDAADIIVTARRIEERLQDVPISISVFNREQLAQRNITAGTDLATYTPSLSVSNQYGPDRAAYAIRGFVQEANTAPSVGVFFADVVTPRGPQGNIPIGGGAGPGRFFDLQNVQVLKGPQGTLFGRNTTGGSVLLVPAKPTNRFEGFAEPSFGNYDMRRFQAVVNVPVNDSFRIRAGFDRQTRDGYVINKSGIGPANYDNIDYWAARLSVDGDLTPNLENYLIVNFIDSDTRGGMEKLLACAPNVAFGFLACDQLQRAKDAGDGFYDVRSPGPIAKSHSREWQIVDTTTWKAGDDVTLKNIASYGQQKLDYSSPTYGTQFNSPAMPAYGLPSYNLGFLDIYSIPGTHAANQETYTEELQLQGTSAGNKLKWQTGVYFEKSNSMTPSSQLASVLISCTDAVANQCTDILGTLFGVPIGSLQRTIFTADYQSIGLYGQASYALTDKLTLTAGARYTWDKSFVDQVNSVTNFAFSTPLPPVCTQLEADANCATQFHQHSQKPTWLADLEYKPTTGVLVFGKYARGYRTGAITAVLPKSIAVAKPEKVDDLELGLKTDFRAPVRGFLNVTGFYDNFSNQQLSLGLVDNPAVAGTVPVAQGVINVGKSRIFGAEVEAGVTPFTGFNLSVSYSYLNTKIRQITLPNLVNSPYLINSAINPGDELLQSPRNKLSATARYTLPFDPGIGAITLGVTFTHSDKSRTNYIDRQALAAGFGTVLGTDLKPVTSDLGISPAYNLVNLNLDWKGVVGTKFDLSLFATNVTKQKFVLFTGGLLPSLGFEGGSLSEPRMYGLRARYSF